MRFTIIVLCAGILAMSSYTANAQDKPPIKLKVDTSDDSDDADDLMDLLDDGGATNKKNYVSATFKTTRVVTAHSIENTGKGVLDFRVNHRFGALNNGTSTFFGLDDANTRIGFDYGVTDWLTVGFGRNSFMKEYDGFVKAKILRQAEEKGSPVTLSYVGAMSIQSMPAPVLPAGQEYPFSNRVYYANQILVARKFNEWLSVQLSPTHVHYNLVPTTPESNDLIAMGIGARFKVSKRVTINGEYFYRVPGTELNGYHNALSLGVDLETGGHVFQFMLSNSRAMTERAYIGQTNGEWGFDKAGAIHLGFNISRVFTVVKPKGFENTRNSIY